MDLEELKKVQILLDPKPNKRKKSKQNKYPNKTINMGV